MTKHLAIERWEPWQSLVGESKSELLRGKYDRVRNEIPAALIPEVLALLDSGGEVARRCAFVVLRELTSAGDERLGDEVKAAFLARVPTIARVEFPRTLIGRAALHYLCGSLDRAEARAIVEALDPATMTEDERAEVVSCLLNLDSPRVRELLMAIKAIGGHAGKRAEFQLEACGLPDMAKVRALAAKWRETRAQEVLHELYLRYLTHQGGKIKIAQIVKLMGPPDRRRGNDIWYAPNDSCSVYLQGDAKGVLRAMNFSG
jgi:hypothetical protein